GLGRFVLSVKRRNNAHHVQSYRYSAQRLYNPYLLVRPAKNLEVALKHTACVVDGRKFIRADVHYEMDIYAGNKEPFRFVTRANERVMKDASPAIRRQAFKAVRMSPTPGSVTRNENQIVGEVTLSPQATRIHYHYRILESEDGMWYFQLKRFAD